MQGGVGDGGCFASFISCIHDVYKGTFNFKDWMNTNNHVIRPICYALGYIVTGIIFYTQQEGFTVLESLYFIIVMTTTVGYGDFTPESDLGKLFTTFYAFIGLGIFTLLMVSPTKL